MNNSGEQSVKNVKALLIKQIERVEEIISELGQHVESDEKARAIAKLMSINIKEALTAIAQNDHAEMSRYYLLFVNTPRFGDDLQKHRDIVGANGAIPDRGDLPPGIIEPIPTHTTKVTINVSELAALLKTIIALILVMSLFNIFTYYRSETLLIDNQNVKSTSSKPYSGLDESKEPNFSKHFNPLNW